MRIGTIGTGAIVSSILTEAAKIEGLHCEAVYSRREETGRALADRFGVHKVYTVLDDLLADPAVDWVYIASPNSLHAEQARRALLAGKHVLCEKPFAPTRAQAEALAALAQEKGLFLLEGITTLFLPNFAWLRAQLPAIGPVRQVSCTFCQYSRKYDALLAGETPNVFHPAFAGGALMDINLYNLYLVYGLFGAPAQLTYHARRHPNGIDTGGILVLEYPDFLCQCTGAKDCQAENGVQIIGERGTLQVEGPASICGRIRLTTAAGEQSYDAQDGQTPWFHELCAIRDLVRAEDHAACRRRLQATVEVAGLLEQARRSAGIVFPGID